MNFPLNNTLTRGVTTDDPSIKSLTDFNKNGLIANQPRFYKKYDAPDPNARNRTVAPFDKENHKTFFRPASAANDAASINQHLGQAREWSNTHMYRTSTHDMQFQGDVAVKEQVPLKQYINPKYGGFIPGKDGNSELGRTINKISRRCFLKEDGFQKSHARWQTHDFMQDQKTFDQTRPTFFRGYGKTTMLVPHEAMGEQWSTTYRKTYHKPNDRSKPVAHQKATVGNCEFDAQMQNSFLQGTVSSGFQSNAQLLDETSWKPEMNTHTDQVRTEYRNRFNQPKPFHKPALVNAHGRLPRTDNRGHFVVYDKVDGANPLRSWNAKTDNYQTNPAQPTELKAYNRGGKTVLTVASSSSAEANFHSHLGATKTYGRAGFI